MEKPKAFIFDIDGTLASNKHRQGYIKSKPKNWPAYNKTMAQDTLIKPVAEILYLLGDCGRHKEIIICSGREEVYRDVTKKWLDANYISCAELYMRKAKDYRSDTIVKQEFLNEIRKDYDVVAVFDDRTSVVDMWRENGLFVFDVNQTREVF